MWLDLTQFIKFNSPDTCSGFQFVILNQVAAIRSVKNNVADQSEREWRLFCTIVNHIQSWPKSNFTKLISH